MKGCLLVMVAACLISAMAADVNAQFTYAIDFSSNAALTAGNGAAQPGIPGWHIGWNNFAPLGAGGSYDMSQGVPSPTVTANGALNVADSDTAASSHGQYSVGETWDGSSGPILKAGSVTVARVRNNGVNSAGFGFGYSTVDGNHTGILGIQNNAVSISGYQYTAPGGMVQYPTSVTPVPGGNVGVYKTYAFTQSVDLVNEPSGYSHTRYDVWVLNRNDVAWSNNPADWTQIITDLQPRLLSAPNEVMTDNSPEATLDGFGTGRASGIMLGSFGPGPGSPLETSGTGSLDYDWLVFRANTPGNYNDGSHPNFMSTIVPWSLDYTGIPVLVPEPGTLALLGLAGVGLLRRRRHA